MIRCSDLRVGDRLRSLDTADKYPEARVIEIHDEKIRVERIGSERRTFIKMPTTRWEFTS